MKFNFDSKKALEIAVTILGLAGVIGTLLSGKVEANNRDALKLELKDEIIKELSNK